MKHTVAIIAVAFAAGCGDEASKNGEPDAAVASFSLTSTDFADGAEIPTAHTCAGADVSPALAWSDAPVGTQSFTLVVDDPDAPSGTFVHWVLFDVNAGATGIAGGGSAGSVGSNDFGVTAWRGPCPPSGPAHHYRFRLRALDVASVGLAGGSTRAEVDAASAGHVLGEVTLTGTFGR